MGISIVVSRLGRVGNPGEVGLGFGRGWGLGLEQLEGAGGGFECWVERGLGHLGGDKCRSPNSPHSWLMRDCNGTTVGAGRGGCRLSQSGHLCLRGI